MFWILWVACSFFRSYLRNMTRFNSLNSSSSKLLFIDFFGYIEFHLLYFLMENLAVEAQMQMVRSNFCFKLKYVAEWGQSGMQSLQTTFHSSFFVFKRGMQTSKTFSLLYIQDWIRNVCKGIFQKKERDLNSFAVTFQVTVIAFKKKLEVVESEILMYGWMEFSCEIISNSKRKLKSKFFFIFANPRFSKFKRSIFQLFFQVLRSQL